MKVDKYQRVFENQNVRPYYSIPHNQGFGEPLKELVNYEYDRVIYVISESYGNKAYIHEDEINKGANYFSKIWKDSKKTKEILAEIRKRFLNAKKLEFNLWKIDIINIKEEKLVSKLNKIQDMLLNILSAHVISQPPHIKSLEKELNNSLEKIKDVDQSLLIRSFTHFEGVLPHAEEEKEIEKYNKLWSNIDSDKRETILEELVKKYGWINAVEGDKPYSKEHYKNKIETYKKSSDIELLDLSKYSVPQAVKIGKLIGELGFLRFWSRFHMLALHYQMKRIVKELAIKKENNLINLMTVKEITNYINGDEINLKEIEKRKKGYVVYLKNGKSHLVSGQETDKYIKLTKEDELSQKQISGFVACRGLIKAKARIIDFNSKDYNKEVSQFKKGEILVTGMTRPQIVHLCNKASAIVTDEGGITSHAAVVSRELNIPCVIGTKDATKIFKTGDFLEVDANKGIITKIIN
ncbi:MAG: PEP-utilizing enzyme [Patescibacteria group bacterium]